MTEQIVRELVNGVWVTKPADEGGGSQPVNWARISFNPAAVLTGTSGFTYQASDLGIVSQAGSDFSIAQVGSSGAIISAAGGRFQFGAYVSVGGTVPTLDGGSAAQRYLWFGAQPGPSSDDAPTDPNIPVDNFGIDAVIPIFVSNARFTIASCYAGTIGYARPGKACYFDFGAIALEGVAGDSIPLDGIFDGVIWQV